jgi:hypothetical protein
MMMKQPVVQSTPDVYGEGGTRTVFTYHAEAVSLDVAVERDRQKSRRGHAAPYVARVGWGTRSGLTLEEAESFAQAVLDGVRRARELVAVANASQAVNA